MTIQRADELYSAGRAAVAASLLSQIEYGDEEQDNQDYANYWNLPAGIVVQDPLGVFV